MPSQGFLYVATGDQFVDEASRSVRSLRKWSPHAEVSLVTDAEVSAPGFDNVIVIEPDLDHDNQWKYGSLFKVTGLLASPYDRTFFVDTDTHFCDSCEELFPLLEFFDLLICHAPLDVSKVEANGQTLSGYYPYNTGVIVFNNTSKVRSFIEDWSLCYRKRIETYTGNQPPFMEALLRHDIKTYVVQSVYNFRTPYLVAFVDKKVKIIHGRVGDYEATDRLLNRDLRHRVWIPAKEKVLVDQHPLSYRIQDRLYRMTPGFLKRTYRLLKQSYKRSTGGN